MENIAREVARKLLEIDAVTLRPKEPFTWASGLRSPIYCDNRIVLSYPGIRNLIKNALVAKSMQFNPFDIVAGVATAGIAHGALLADALDKPFVYVRSKAKAHGRQNMIEGKVIAGQKALVIEDLISTGKSSLAAVRALKGAGIFISGVLAIFSYGFPHAEKNFSKENIPFDVLTNYDNLVNEAISSQYISKTEGRLLSEWNAQPSAWYDKYFSKYNT